MHLIECSLLLSDIFETSIVYVGCLGNSREDEIKMKLLCSYEILRYLICHFNQL